MTTQEQYLCDLANARLMEIFELNSQIAQQAREIQRLKHQCKQDVTDQIYGNLMSLYDKSSQQ
jgi:hypothetical protein